MNHKTSHLSRGIEVWAYKNTPKSPYPPLIIRRVQHLSFRREPDVVGSRGGWIGSQVNARPGTRVYLGLGVE